MRAVYWVYREELTAFAAELIVGCEGPAVGRGHVDTRVVRGALAQAVHACLVRLTPVGFFAVRVCGAGSPGGIRTDCSWNKKGNKGQSWEKGINT